jgi:hypothetical protein
MWVRRDESRRTPPRSCRTAPTEEIVEPHLTTPSGKTHVDSAFPDSIEFPIADSFETPASTKFFPHGVPMLIIERPAEPAGAATQLRPEGEQQ